VLPGDLGAFPGQQDLRSELRHTPGICVLTGGQTGVDTTAAVTALRAGLAAHLFFPRGFRQEDGPITDVRRRAFRGATLHELPSPEFADRTWACVGLADAVVLVDPAGGEGCQETVRAARTLGRPLLSDAGYGPGLGSGLGEVADWLERHGVRLLLIAGCRRSLLASAGRASLAQAQVEKVIIAARQRHARLTSAAPG